MDTKRWHDADLGGSYVGLGNDRPRGPMEVKDGLDPGLAVVRYVYDGIRVDREWSVIEDRGFTWWGHRLATRVWSEPGVDDDGIEAYRVVARTSLLEHVADMSMATKVLDVGNRMAVTSALVPDAVSGKIDYVASMWVHQDTRSWVASLFSIVVSMQAAQAHGQAEQLAPLLGATPAWTAHPGSGARAEPDDMLAMMSVIAAAGREPSAWIGPEMERAVDDIRGIPVVTRVVGDGTTIVFHLEDRGESGLVRVTTQAPHPSLGNGLLVRSSIDSDAVVDESWAVSMNQRELEVVNPAMFLGSWVGAADRPTFVTFLPSFAANSGIGIMNVAMSALNRTMWAMRDPIAA